MPRWLFLGALLLVACRACPAEVARIEISGPVRIEGSIRIELPKLESCRADFIEIRATSSRAQLPPAPEEAWSKDGFNRPTWGYLVVNNERTPLFHYGEVGRALRLTPREFDGVWGWARTITSFPAPRTVVLTPAAPTSVERISYVCHRARGADYQ